MRQILCTLSANGLLKRQLPMFATACLIAEFNHTYQCNVSPVAKQRKALQDCGVPALAGDSFDPT